MELSLLLSEVLEFFFFEDFFEGLFDALSDEHFENWLHLHVEVEELVGHDLSGGVDASLGGDVLRSWRAVQEQIRLASHIGFFYSVSQFFEVRFSLDRKISRRFSGVYLTWTLMCRLPSTGRGDLRLSSSSFSCRSLASLARFFSAFRWRSIGLS